MTDTPFESLESAQRYVALLREAVEETQSEVREDMAGVTGDHRARELQALRLVDLKLTQLNAQLRAAGGILNDLKMLRRVLIPQPEFSART